jgi:hypothetical protein
MKTIGEILGKNNSTLTKLIRKTQTSRDLAFIFQNALEANLAKHCRFASLEGHVITVTATNAAWATRLRYAIPDMIKILRTQPEFKMVTNIRYFVSPPTHTATSKKKQKKLSADNEILWQETLDRLKRHERGF